MKLKTFLFLVLFPVMTFAQGAPVVGMTAVPEGSFPYSISSAFEHVPPSVNTDVSNQTLGVYVIRTGEEFTIGRHVFAAQFAHAGEAVVRITDACLVDAADGKVIAGPVDMVDGKLSFTDTVTYHQGKRIVALKAKISGLPNGAECRITTTPATDWSGAFMLSGQPLVFARESHEIVLGTVSVMSEPAVTITVNTPPDFHNVLTQAILAQINLADYRIMQMRSKCGQIGDRACTSEEQQELAHIWAELDASFREVDRLMKMSDLPDPVILAISLPYIKLIRSKPLADEAYSRALNYNAKG